jgi:hypothetical protein
MTMPTIYLHSAVTDEKRHLRLYGGDLVEPLPEDVIAKYDKRPGVPHQPDSGTCGQSKSGRFPCA